MLRLRRLAGAGFDLNQVGLPYWQWMDLGLVMEIDQAAREIKADG